MVIKLIKHEFKDASRRFMPIIGMIVAASIILTMTINIETIYRQDIALAMLMLVLMGLGVAVVVMSFMAFIDLLYTSLYNKNGYRLFTLPVETWEIITAKITVYALWNLIVGVVTFIAFLIIAAFSIPDFNSILLVMKNFFAFLREVIELRVVLVVLLDLISSNLLTIAIFLFAGSVINSRYVQNHRGIKMFILFLVLSALFNQIFMLVTSNAHFVLNFDVNPEVFMDPNFDPTLNGWANWLYIESDLKGLRDTALLSAIYTTVSLMLFYGTSWFWNHKLEIID